MVNEPNVHTASVLEQEIAWLTKVLDLRIRLYFDHETEFSSIEEIPVPPAGDGPYGHLVRQEGLTPQERIVLLLALVPHLRPELLDVFFTKNAEFDREFTEFGGYRFGRHPGFFPTVATAIFVLSGNDLSRRIRAQELFEKDAPLRKSGILDLRPQPEELTILERPLRISADHLTHLLTGRPHRPEFSMQFPARRINTKLQWEDLILDPEVIDQIEDIHGWLSHGSVLLEEWGLGKRLNPGFHSLFYGPPGTGKTLCACLLGKTSGRDVYRIDLSQVISKYIGETEKNLARVFEYAENKGWLLFFDEADALFGKRTDIRDARDRYANQEVAYLLQRIESFHGVIILATNKRTNFDEAFSRRFQSIIHFPMPKPAHRFEIWKRGFSSHSRLEPGIDLRRFSDQYEISGGTIMNVVKYSSLKALMAGSNVITRKALEDGIRKELSKEGKTID